MEVHTRFEFRKGTDTIRVEVLEDGTIKTYTDKVSAPNHINAEALMREIDKLAGGKATVKRRNPSTSSVQHSQQQKG